MTSSLSVSRQRNFFVRLFRAVPGRGRFQLTNLLGFILVLQIGLVLGFGLGL